MIYKAMTNDANIIGKLTDLLGDDLKLVNAHIIKNMQSPITLIPTLAGHLIQSGGKRIRPLLTLATARMIGYQGERHIPYAACVEFIHTATLLHDDVIDQSALRRGKDTANAIWGNEASVLVGDFLFSRSFQMMVADGDIDVLKLLSDTSAIIAEGEVHQLLTANNPDCDYQQYLQVIEAKTAALFAAATKVSGIIDGQGQTVQQNLYNYGHSLGILFQITDDVLDYQATTKTLGKDIGDDFREGKITLPIILLWQQANDKEKKFLEKCLKDLQQEKDDFSSVLSLFEKYNCITLCHQKAQEYAEAAKKSLKNMPDNIYKSCLIGLVEFCLHREK